MAFAMWMVLTCVSESLLRIRAIGFMGLGWSSGMRTMNAFVSMMEPWVVLRVKWDFVEKLFSPVICLRQHGLRREGVPHG